MIFEHVFTGHYVHVEQIFLGNIDRYEKKDLDFGKGLWNEICQDPGGEATAYNRFQKAEMGEDAPPTPFEDASKGTDVGKGYHIDSWTFRHRLCGREPRPHRFNLDMEQWNRRPRISLSSLRTCKVIYKEMRLLPYSNNKLLFRSPGAFQALAATCRPEQFRAIQHISLPVAMGSAPYSAGRSRLWTSIIWDYNLTGRLRRLKYLDLTIELYFPRDLFSDRPQQRKPGLDDCIDEIRLSGKNRVNAATGWMEQFSHLSRHTKAFRVVVCDDPESSWGVLGKPVAMKDWRMRSDVPWIRERNIKCLTIEQKQALASGFEERLVAQSKISLEAEQIAEK